MTYRIDGGFPGGFFPPMNGTLPGAGPGAGGPGGPGAPGGPGGWLPVPPPMPPMPPVGGQPGQGGKLHFKSIPQDLDTNRSY